MYGVKLKTMKTALGEPNKAEVFFGHSMMGQTSGTPSPTKLGDFNFLQETFNPHPDMLMVEDIGAVLVNTLGDASMDSFTDLSSILIEPNFLEHPDGNGKEEDTTSPTLLDMDEDMKHQQYYSLKCPSPVPEAEDSSSDLAQLSAKVGLKRSRAPSLDHDYSTKRARLSPSPMPASVESVEESFLVPDFSPASSPCSSVSSLNTSTKDQQKQRRQKNNLASKRSREIRKTKFKNMEGEAQRLIEENVRLERRVAELEKLAKDMKDALVKKFKIKT